MVYMCACVWDMDILMWESNKIGGNKIWVQHSIKNFIPLLKLGDVGPSFL